MIDNKDLLKLKIPKNSTIVVHASLKNLENDITKYSEITKEILEKFDDVFNPIDIFVPTFTYSFTKNKAFDVANSTSEVGRFSEEVRKYLPARNRSVDPIFSVINYKNDANVYDIDNSEAFGTKSIWSYLENTQHYIFNINLDSPIVATQLHYLEHQHKVPYRFNKFFEGSITDNNRIKSTVNYKYYVRNSDLPNEWDRNKIYTYAKSNNAVKQLQNIKVFNWNKLSNLLSQNLKKNSSFLLK